MSQSHTQQIRTYECEAISLKENTSVRDFKTTHHGPRNSDYIRFKLFRFVVFILVAERNRDVSAIERETKGILVLISDATR